jgi:hypothetical protein
VKDGQGALIFLLLFLVSGDGGIEFVAGLSCCRARPCGDGIACCFITAGVVAGKEGKVSDEAAVKLPNPLCLLVCFSFHATDDVGGKHQTESGAARPERSPFPRVDYLFLLCQVGLVYSI